MAYTSSLFKPTNEVSGHLEPADGIGVVDIIQNFYWTISPQLAREDVTVMELREYQILGGQLRASWDYWQKQYKGVLADIGSDLSNFGQTQQNRAGDYLDKIGSDINDIFDGGRAASPYESLYQAVPTGFTYRLPYFSDFNQSVQNSWSDSTNTIDSLINEFISNTQQVGLSNLRYGLGSRNTTGKIGRQLGQLASGIVKQAAFKLPSIVYPSVKTEMPQSWNGTSGATYSIGFDLLNTVEYDAIRRNWELVYLLTHQNAGFRRNALISYPPCIYEIKIPGIRFCPAAYLNISVGNIGQTRLVNIDGYGPKAIPEAYRVAVSVTELLQYTRNIHEGLLENDSKVSAISQPSRSARNVSDAEPAAADPRPSGLDNINNVLTNGSGPFAPSNATP